MPQAAPCPHYTSLAQCKSAAAHSPPPRVANQACPTDAPLRAPSGRVSLRIGCDAITAQSMLPPSATLGRSGGRSGGRCRLVWGVRVPFRPSPLAPYCRLPSWSPGADVSTRLRQGRCSSDPPCLGGAGGAQLAVAALFLMRVLHVARGLLAQKIGAFAWPCGRRRSRAAAKKHWIVLN